MMDNALKQAYTQIVVRVVATRAAVVFLAAWTIDYWQAWALLAVNAAGEFGTTQYLVRHDRALLERRLKAGVGDEDRADRKAVQLIIRMAMLAVLVVSALDHRFGWSHVPTGVNILGDAIVAAGLVIVWLTFRANSFASGIVELADEQRVISSGPYAVVRHPMYTGMIVMLAGMAPALGSWWGLAGVGAFAVGIVFRLREEEQFLARNLVGYDEYRRAVPHRLAPLVW